MPIIKTLVLSSSLLALASTAVADIKLPAPPSKFASQSECSEYIQNNYVWPILENNFSSPYAAYFETFSQRTGSTTTGTCSNGDCVEYYGGDATTGKAFGSGCMLADAFFSQYWPTAWTDLNEEVQRANNNEPTLSSKVYAVKCSYKINDKANKTCELIVQNTTKW